MSENKAEDTRKIITEENFLKKNSNNSVQYQILHAHIVVFYIYI